MPLLPLFTYSEAPLRELVYYEIVAEEIVRTLVASIGLILAVPITTAVACITLTRGAAADEPGVETEWHAFAGKRDRSAQRTPPCQG